MSTRSTSSNLFSPLRDPESLIRRRNLSEPSSLFDFEEVMSIPHNNMGLPPARPPPPNNNGPPLVVRPNEQAPRSMEELCQPSINGRGGPIAPIPIQATDFGLRHHMIQQVQNTCQFHGLSGDDANRHIDKFLEVTQHMKQNGVSDDALRLSLFPYSLTHHATSWHRDTINAAAGGTFMQKTPKECYELIENMTAHHNHWDTSAERGELTRSTTSSSPEIATLNKKLDDLSNVILKISQSNQQVNVFNPSCETCGGPHRYTECPAVSGYTQETAYATTGDVKAITTRSGVAYDGPTIPPTLSLLPKEVERETEATKDKLDECLALTDLGASINLMPLSVWKHLSLSELTSTRMTLELANRSTVTPAGVAEDVFVKVGKFYFLADFVVVDYEVDPRVPLILGRHFLRMARALIDVHSEEMTLQVNNEAITFKVRHTSRYSRNYYDETVHQVNVIDVACVEYAQE
ncbi:reverse transcriptase domain-containing protein, partial [Tanacetum coccineum]